MDKQALVNGIAALIEGSAKVPLPPRTESFEEFGKHMAEGLMQLTYDPMPQRGIRGILQLQQAHGTPEERAKADKTFKANCDEFQRLFGNAALVERLKRTYIGAYAESINCPVTTVSFSDAINWRSNQPKV